jgi:ABC-type polar amino acid transport system ATPase subunit
MDARSTLRQTCRKVGMVFQFHYLFEHLSALQNVCLAPIHAHGVARGAAESRGLELLKTLGVEHRATAFPRELSGGEAQRVPTLLPNQSRRPRWTPRVGRNWARSCGVLRARAGRS